MELSGVAENCDVGGQNPRSVSVAQDATASTTFTVTCEGPAPATRLAFATQPPSPQGPGSTFAVNVVAQDAQGGTATAYTGLVRLTLLTGGQPASLEGGDKQVNAVNGVATFTNLKVQGLCSSCRLRASADGLVLATSEGFSVVLGLAPPAQ